MELEAINWKIFRPRGMEFIHAMSEKPEESARALYSLMQSEPRYRDPLFFLPIVNELDRSPSSIFCSSDVRDKIYQLGRENTEKVESEFGLTFNRECK